jgi:hypothetical protein
VLLTDLCYESLVAWGRWTWLWTFLRPSGSLCLFCGGNRGSSVWLWHLHQKSCNQIHLFAEQWERDQVILSKWTQ